MSPERWRELYAEGREFWRKQLEERGPWTWQRADVLLVLLSREHRSFDAQKVAAVDAISELVARLP